MGDAPAMHSIGCLSRPLLPKISSFAANFNGSRGDGTCVVATSWSSTDLFHGPTGTDMTKDG